MVFCLSLSLGATANESIGNNQEEAKQVFAESEEDENYVLFFKDVLSD